MPTIN